MFGALITKLINPEKLAKKALSDLGPMAAEALLVEFFNGRMKAESRQRLGGHLVEAGEALKAGRVRDASRELGEVLGEVRF